MSEGESTARNAFHGDAHGAVVQVGSVHGDIRVGQGRDLPVPAQLRARPAHFTNRSAELALLARARERAAETGSPHLVVLSGPGGVGKTSLGLSWLHQIRDLFPDGQLFADLRGGGWSQPAPPGEPLEGFLRAFGLAGPQIPVEAEEQAALFRSLTAGRRLIIMLDNAQTAAQVRPLLPGHGPSLVVVTTRRRLSGLTLEGASFVPVEPLEEDHAVELLSEILGAERTDAEPHEARSLVRLCGRFPLTVCTSAARLRVRHRWPIAHLVAELKDERHRLTLLSAEEDVSVRAVFDVSHDGLTPTAKRLFRLLALHPGPRMDTASAAALAGWRVPETAAVLDQLTGAHMIDEEAPAVYRFHDLLRLYSRELLDLYEDEEARAAAFARLVRHRLSAAVAADLAVIPERWHVGEVYRTARPGRFADAAAALDWLEAELPGLLALQRAAAERGLHSVVWQLSEALWGLFVNRKHYTAWLECYTAGLEAARADGGGPAEARMLTCLANARLNLREFAEAERLCAQAVQVARAAGHTPAEAAALEGLGAARLGAGKAEDALLAFTACRELNLGSPRGTAMATRRIGEALRALGRDAEAVPHLEEALAFFAERGDRYNQSRILVSLGHLHDRLGGPAAARGAFERALRLAGGLGAPREMANAELGLAGLAERAGEPAARRAHLLRALALLEGIEAPDRADVVAQLAALDAGEGPG